MTDTCRLFLLITPLDLSPLLTSPILQTSKTFDIRFSEVDSMHIVWHGSYALYFEDAREEFGRVFGLSYSCYVENGC